MTAIPEPAVASRERTLLQPEDTAVSAVTKTDDASPITNVPDMTVSIRKSAVIERSPSLKGASVDSRFVLPKCPQFPPKEFQPVEAFVSNAITSRDSKTYRAILDSIRKAQDPPMLCKVLVALRGTTLHQLSGNPKGHDHLLHLLFRLDPFLKEEHPKLPGLYSLADAHLHLILALVSANSVFLTPSMKALWRLLVNVNDAPEERTRRVHAALATMIRLVPKGNSEIFPVLASSFPFRTKPTKDLVWYTQQCLTVLQYVPTLHSQILELLLDKCLEMDVEIKIDQQGKVSIDTSSHHSLEHAEDEMFELEIDEDVKPMRQDNENVEEQVDEMADKLDSLMTILLEHIRAHATEHGAQSLYRMVSPVFDSSVLTTHRSKFVQFVVLVICGLEHELLDDATIMAELDREFAAKLIDIILDPYRATVTRQSGACYLASFVSRATYVSPETTCEAISALLKWAEAYMASGYSLRASDLREQCDLHSLFYTVCQAAFYMMCFRGADAMNYYRSAMEYHATHQGEFPNDDASFADPEHVDIGPDRWTKICAHDLQPLRFCLESVRGEFLHVAHVFQLLPPQLLERLNADDSKMATHSKPRKPSVITTAATLAKRRKNGGVGGIGQGSNPLDSFFPYDPYLLCRSHRFVEPFYKNWEGSIEEEEDDDLSDDDGENGADDSSVEAASASSSDDDEDRATHMPQSVDSTSHLQPMSYVSTATIESSSTKSSLQPGTPEGLLQKKQLQREAWSETLKRSRAPSIENGSW